MDDSDDDSFKPKPVPRYALERYNGKQGFSDVSFGPDEIPSSSTGQLNAAITAHQTALRTLSLRAQSIPSFSAMQEFLENADTPESLEKQIKDLEKRHREDLEKFYDSHARQHIQDTMEWYRLTDDTMYIDKYENQANGPVDPRKQQTLQDPLDELYARAHAVNIHSLPWAAEYSTLRQAYLSKYIELKTQLKKAKEQELKAFPRSIAEFWTKPKEMQMRVAKFLRADNTQQEKMMTENDWPSRLTQPLKNEAKKDHGFGSDLTAMLITASMTTSDPRKR